MCGIFAYQGVDREKSQLIKDYMTLQHRGPDHSEYVQPVDGLFLGFHRLAINGLDDKSNQPMHLDGCWLIANAEIFNYKALANAHDIELQTNSDCEIIIHLYRRLGMDRLLELIDGEFAFVLYDEIQDMVIAARDHLGIRGMYFGRNKSGAMAFASEAKALIFMDELEQFPTGSWYTEATGFKRYYTHKYARHDMASESDICDQIKYLLTEAVERRMMSDRPIGCLLSGGLDSSLIAAIAARLNKKRWPIETFSVGMQGSPDLQHANEVARHIGSRHHSFELTEEEFLAELEPTVYMTGSFDVTTIRASVGHRLVSNLVRQYSEVKVLFTGETIDECGSYLYFQNAPSDEAFQDEARRLLKDIHYFDMLRGDRSISHAGLEARVPFADRSFLNFYMGIDPALRQFSDSRIEKYLLRKAFSGDNLLPESVLWRRKNGFSDSVSNLTKSWSEIIKKHVDTLISDDEYKSERFKYQHDTPRTKEGYYYRKVFSKYYGRHQKLTPYQWLPRWCGDIDDPSARKLKIYQAD